MNSSWLNQLGMIIYQEVIKFFKGLKRREKL